MLALYGDDDSVIILGTILGTIHQRPIPQQS